MTIATLGNICMILLISKSFNDALKSVMVCKYVFKEDIHNQL